MQIPFYLLGDGWLNPTGLGRIARDLHGVLGVRQIGFHPPGLLTNGLLSQHSFAHLGDDWGAQFVVPWLKEQHPDLMGQGILCIVWDPSRAISYLPPMREQLPEWQVWGYFAVDGHTRQGTIGGPAAVAIRNFDRVTAYSEYGARVLREARGRGPVTWLPHGHGITQPPFFDHGVMQQLHPYWARDPRGWLIGCVATNQPRKDLQLFIETLSELRKQGERVYGWLHTDLLQKTWDLPELAKAWQVEKALRVTVGTLSDAQLWQCYLACTATICVGRGEGFGYPIVESLALGVPCLAMDYAGGAEFTPREFRYGWQGVDYANPYAIGRPLGYATDLCARLLEIRQTDDRRELEAYCRGSVAHLHWSSLGPRWQAWKHVGLEGL